MTIDSEYYTRKDEYQWFNKITIRSRSIILKLTQQELKKLTEPTLVGILATVNKDGSPQATPIWYLYDGETFNVTGHTARVKVKNIRSNPKVSLVIVDTFNNGPPLIVNGTAKLIESGADKYTEKMCVRYQCDKKGLEIAAKLIEDASNIKERRVIIQIAPERIIYGK